MNLKRLVIILLAAAAAWSGLARADRGSRHDWHRPSVGIVVTPYWSPWMYPSHSWYPYYPIYNPPVIIERSQPPVYIERGAAPQASEPPSAPDQYWYYCEASRTYYPYVSECSGGWRKVVPQPSDLPR